MYWRIWGELLVSQIITHPLNRKNAAEPMAMPANIRSISQQKSFAIRLVQCDPLRFGYIAEADTEAKLVRDPSPQLTETTVPSAP